MRPTSSTASLLVGAVLLAAATSSTLAAEPTWKLKVFDTFQPSHFIPAQGTKPWMDRITELTNGQVQFEYYPAEQMGKQTDLPRLLAAGTADIAFVGAGLMPDDFPLTSVGSFPSKATTAAAVTKAYWSLVAVDSPLRSEYITKHIVPLAFFGFTQYEIFTSEKPVRRLEELRGLKIRANNGTQAEMIRALGATPVPVLSNDLYGALEKHNVDGALFPYPSARSANFDKVVRFATQGGYLGSAIVGYAISEKLWADLPKDVQAAFEKASAEFMDRISSYQDKMNDDDRQYLSDRGITFSKFEKAEVDRWHSAIKPVAAEWITALSKKNLPAKEVYEAWISEKN